MSIHSSLTVKKFGKGGHRNVLKRFERIERLKDEERWDEETTIMGMPKVKNIKLSKK